jgi:hypothetical protein
LGHFARIGIGILGKKLNCERKIETSNEKNFKNYIEAENIKN